jgi:hypothetical protein
MSVLYFEPSVRVELSSLANRAADDVGLSIARAAVDSENRDNATRVTIKGFNLTRISIFRWATNLVKSCKALDRRGFARDQGGAEVERRWVRHKIGHFNFRSIAG